MKIVIMNPVMGDAYGQERVIRDSTNLLRHAGHQVYFLTEHIRGELCENDGMKAIPFLSSAHPLRTPRILSRVTQETMQFLNSVKPDVVHLTDLFCGSLMLNIFKEYPTVHTCHLNSTTCPASVRMTENAKICTKKSGWLCLYHDRKQRCYKNYKDVFRKADATYTHLSKKKALKQGVRRVIAVSQYIYATLLLDGFDSEKLELIYNPISLTNEPNYPRIKGQLLYVSRLERYKGLEVTLHGLASIKDIPWNLLVCGEGSYRPQIEKLIYDLNLQNRVSLLGKVSYQKIQELQRTSWLCLQTNLGPETFGLAIAEASQSGLPCIISDMPAINEIVAHQKSGLIVPANNSAALAAAVVQLWENPTLWEHLSENAKQLIRIRFSPEQHLEKTVSMYERVVAGEGLEPPTKGL